MRKVPCVDAGKVNGAITSTPRLFIRVDAGIVSFLSEILCNSFENMSCLLSTYREENLYPASHHHANIKTDNLFLRTHFPHHAHRPRQIERRRWV